MEITGRGNRHVRIAARAESCGLLRGVVPDARIDDHPVAGTSAKASRTPDPSGQAFGRVETCRTVGNR
jgi:hypothetical protein